MKRFKNFKISFFLATRQIKKANAWVNFLIIFIMTVTFLNLVFISGILIGVVEGASKDVRQHYSGDIIITPQNKKISIVNTSQLLDKINALPQVKNISVRYLQNAEIRTNKKNTTKRNETKNAINALLTGIDFEEENMTTDLENFLIAGEYIDSSSSNRVLIGSGLLSQYSSVIEVNSLEDVSVGDTLKINMLGEAREYIVGGILKSKIPEINTRIFIDKKEFVMLAGREPQSTNEIVLTLSNIQELNEIKDIITEFTKKSDAQAETWEENQGQFFNDLSTTFSVLGGIVGAIGLIVASITLFIVLFINAISREKYIGILRGIGIDSSIIKYSYVFQSIFYTFVGSFFGILLLYLFLVPYFEKNPLDFPFSDGTLAVTNIGVLIRLFILFSSSVIAGFVPAHLIVKKNAIDSILGR